MCIRDRVFHRQRGERHGYGYGPGTLAGEFAREDVKVLERGYADLHRAALGQAGKDALRPGALEREQRLLLPGEKHLRPVAVRLLRARPGRGDAAVRYGKREMRTLRQLGAGEQIRQRTEEEAEQQYYKQRAEAGKEYYLGLFGCLLYTSPSPRDCS